MAQGRAEPPSAGIGLSPASGAVRLGTSGWSYDDWVGPVYPTRLKDRPGEWFAHYAREFDAVEVNSTFYRLPPPPVVAGWIRKAGEIGGPFEFSLKAPQETTHSALPAGDVLRVRETLAPFLAGVVEPLRAAGVLGAVLLQASPHVHAGPASLAAIEAALAALDGVPVAVELRHRSWIVDGRVRDDVLGLLRAHGAALASVDGPGFPPRTIRTGRHAYIRFHGRRPDVWFEGSGGAGESEAGARSGTMERYDYLYSREELEPWARVVRRAAEEHDTVRVFFNNHPGGQAVANAREFRALLPVAAPSRPPESQRVLDDF